jgi:hypothetical protein
VGARKHTTRRRTVTHDGESPHVASLPSCLSEEDAASEREPRCAHEKKRYVTHGAMAAAGTSAVAAAVEGDDEEVDVDN